MNRALAGTCADPAHDTIEMEAAETLKPPHLDAYLEFLKADSALCIIDAVLFRGLVAEDARAAWGRGAAHGDPDLLADAGYGGRQSGSLGGRVEGG